MNQLQNVFITGSSSGFGFAIAQTLLARGYTVFATRRDPAGRNQKSYLGITEVSLSRLKRSLRLENQPNGVQAYVSQR